VTDIKIGYEQMFARRKGQSPLPTAVVYPCSGDALIGAVEAAKAGLIAPLLVILTDEELMIARHTAAMVTETVQ
jgi:hypothetical protein